MWPWRPHVAWVNPRAFVVWSAGAWVKTSADAISFWVDPQPSWDMSPSYLSVFNTIVRPLWIHHPWSS